MHGFLIAWLAACTGSTDTEPAAATTPSPPTETSTSTTPTVIPITDTTGTIDTETDNGDTDTGSTTPASVWQPAPGTTWQWQLTGAIDTTVDVTMYDIDLFDPAQATIDALHADGRIVICYFSAGSWEAWRDDASDYPEAALGDPLDGWPDERWVDIRDSAVRDILRARMDEAVNRGCDGVEPDNVDGYANGNGLGLVRADQLDFNRFLADEAHARGLSVGLKNATDLVNLLEPYFDWALNEECLSYDECDTEQPFIAAGKAVFHVEYVNRANQLQDRADLVCAQPERADFSTLVKTWDLDAAGVACP